MVLLAIPQGWVVVAAAPVVLLVVVTAAAVLVATTVTITLLLLNMLSFLSLLQETVMERRVELLT